MRRKKRRCKNGKNGKTRTKHRKLYLPVRYVTRPQKRKRTKARACLAGGFCAAQRITECVRCTEAYLTACMIAGVHARLETGVPPNVEAAWKEAKAAIEEMNALCRTLALPDFLPEEPEAARQVLAERRRALLEIKKEVNSNDADDR